MWLEYYNLGYAERMMDSVIQYISVLLAVSLIGFGPEAAYGETPEDVAHFEQEVRPVLVSKCVQCHGANQQEANLRLDSLEAMLAGGDSGPAVLPGKPEESLLLEALRYESFEMPPNGQLSSRTIHQFEQWIADGAAWPIGGAPLREDQNVLTAADRQWWAFQPVVKTEPPSTGENSWPSNAIDRFVLDRMAEHDMRPAPEAAKWILIRRLYFDLLGLPPTPEEIDAFVRDRSPDAWESLVDRLLDDQRYGEHWARYWLDLVRYSESDGWNQDAYRPHIWRYRDYVVQSLNDDKPYPDFVREQLAGDEIPGDDPDHLVAAGFLRLGIYEYNQRDARSHWNDIMNEITDVTGDVFLGLSMACARCHSHKFDPIPQHDYFQLRAFFEPLSWRDDLVAATRAQQAEHAEKMAGWEEATQDIRSRLDDLLNPYYDRKWKSTVDKFPLDIQACFHMPEEDRTSWQHQMAYLVSRQFLEEGGGPLKSLSKEDKARHEELKKELAAFDSLKPEPLPALMTATDFEGIASPTYIPDASDRAPIDPGFLTVMQPLPAGSAADTTDEAIHRSGSSGRRTALARWIGHPDNPLTTRVIVNRIWQRHFGRGLVATSSDFGMQGQRPTHPELLDWLTATFVEQGWSFKKLHKQILMSSTWRQSAHHPSAGQYQPLDPAEDLLWRFPVRRLQAEQIRDAMLLASGELSPKLGGPSVDETEPRRALYIKSFRNKNDTLMHGFDMANGLKSVPERDTTTTPTQALLMINGDYALTLAKKMADRLLASPSSTPEQTLQRIFRSTWGRPATASELQRAMHFVGVPQGEDGPSIAAEGLHDLCHLLFNSNQFLYIE